MGNNNESSTAKYRGGPISKENIQSAIDKLSEIERSFGEVVQDQEEVNNWMFLKDINLPMALDAIIYHAKIDNKLCDVKMIISSVEDGFNQLKCTQSGCSLKAIMCQKQNNDTPAKLYCEKHSHLVDQLNKDLNYFNEELKKNKSILKSLERLLVVIQEQKEYLLSENSNKEMITYINIKEKLDEEYANLKNVLCGMTMKAKKLLNTEKNTNKTLQYEHFSFVKSGSEKCKQSIFEILRLMFEVNMKYEIEAKLKTILNWSEEIEQYKEESKSSSVYSVPDEIYGNEFVLCKIPTQTLKKIKELEKRVQTLAEAAIDYHENVQRHKITINKVKQILMGKDIKEFIEKSQLKKREEFKISEEKFLKLYLKIKDEDEDEDEEIPTTSEIDLNLDNKKTKDKLFIKECVTSKLRFPDIIGISIDNIAGLSSDIVSFLSYCTPVELQNLNINISSDLMICVKSKFYIDAFSEAARRTIKCVKFGNFDFSSKELQTIIRAAHNAQEIEFFFCSIHCSFGLDFGTDLSFNTWSLRFCLCGYTKYKEITTDWNKRPADFSFIVDAIRNSGLRASLQELGIYDDDTLSVNEIQKELNEKGMSHIFVTDKR